MNTAIVKMLLLILLCNSYSFAVVAQGHPYSPRFSHEIENGIKDGSISATRAALLYSFIGEYYSSVNLTDIPISWGVDSLQLGAYTVEPALNHIFTHAEKHRIVIISENHLRPQHRIFAKKVIEVLSKVGFNHLGLETFASQNNDNILLDENLENRGYPLNSPLTGTYTMEPKMGDLVRQAISHNYKVFAYERTQKIEGKDRDEIQADNIIRHLKQHPDAKLIILCGFHHAIESDDLKRGTSHWMAKFLKDKTGIDPLTIYQDNFTEKFCRNEHELLRTLVLDVPSVFVDSSRQIPRLSPQVDIEVIHPKTYFREGRPNWLYENETFQAVQPNIDRTTAKFPLIVSAFYANEKNSVPLDRIEIKHKYDHKALILKKGKYLIEIDSKDEQNSYQLELE